MGSRSIHSGATTELPCWRWEFVSSPPRDCSRGEGSTPAPHLASFGQAILLVPQPLAGRVQALLAHPVALQLLLHLPLRLGFPLLQLPNARQELLVAVHLALPRRTPGETAREQAEPSPLCPPDRTETQSRATDKARAKPTGPPRPQQDALQGERPATAARRRISRRPYAPRCRTRSSSYTSSKVILAAGATLTDTWNCSVFLPVALGEEGIRSAPQTRGG